MSYYDSKLSLAQELLNVFYLSTNSLSKEAQKIVNSAKDKKDVADHALKICAEVLGENPSNIKAHYISGLMNSFKGVTHRSSAIIHLQYVVDNAKTNAGKEFLNSLATYKYIEDGVVKNASIARVLSDVYSELGKLYQGEKIWVQAIECFKQLTILRPAAPHGWIRLAQCLNESLGPIEGVKLLEHAQTLDVYIPKPYPVTGYEPTDQEPSVDNGFKQVIDHHLVEYRDKANLQKDILVVIKDNPGILQKDIAEHIKPEVAKQTISANAKMLERLAKISRVKRGGTYECRLV